MAARRRKRRMVLILLAVGVVAYALLTGGLFCERCRDFDGQTNIQLVPGLKSDVWLAPRVREVNVPFVGHYYGTSVPCDLRLQVFDDAKAYASISVSEIVVAYADGQTVRLTPAWTRPLRPHTQSNSSAGRVIRTEMMMLSDAIPGVVLRHEDARITVTGKLVKLSGAEVAFSSSEFFKARSTFRMTTYWIALSDV